MLVIRDDFSIEIADWGNAGDRTALCAVREQVFVREQRVPPEMERDEDDPRCTHVLSRARAGAPIGTGRLAPHGQIGRIAVLSERRGDGVGATVLRALLEQARARGLPEVHLHAQKEAVDFYRKFGFAASGEDFLEAGIPHQPMCLPLDAMPAPSRNPSPVRPQVRTLTAQTREQLIEAILRDTRHELRILVDELDPVLLNDSACLVELRRVAISGRGASIRVIARSIEHAQREGNRVLDLAQRLPSIIQFRRPVEEVDRGYLSAFLCSDSSGYLFRPVARRMESVGSTYSPSRAVQLQTLFDQVWERSKSMNELRPLGI